MGKRHRGVAVGPRWREWLPTPGPEGEQPVPGPGTAGFDLEQECSVVRGDREVPLAFELGDLGRPQSALPPEAVADSPKHRRLASTSCEPVYATPDFGGAPLRHPETLPDGKLTAAPAQRAL